MTSPDKKTLSHSNILVGSDRRKLMEWAEIVATNMFCLQDGTDTPCGVCAACRKIKAGSHPDYHIYDADAVKVVDARQIKRDAAIRPSEAEFKIFVITNADSMNTEAQNALLKVIEEPQNTYFLLLCLNENELLSTVRSRCAKFFMGVEAEDEVLGRVKAENGDIGEIAEAMARAVAAGDELMLYRAMSELGAKKRDKMPVFFTLARYELHSLLGKKEISNKKKIIDIYEYLHRESDKLVVNPGVYGMSIALCAGIWDILK